MWKLSRYGFWTDVLGTILGIAIGAGIMAGIELYHALSSEVSGQVIYEQGAKFRKVELVTRQTDPARFHQLVHTSFAFGGICLGISMTGLAVCYCVCRKRDV
jgi:hypothetical protein